MPDALYSLREVECSYDKEKPILRIKHLDIPAGKLIVMIGKSGSGKSTILETLGLMNNTIVKGEILFCPGNDQILNLVDLWNNDNKLAEVRNNYLSFIFQDTNLMTNFTAYENACIPQLIQGITMDKAMQKVSVAMNQVGISDEVADTKVFKLSGGQKQRIAFVRAITPEFVVLFGDEPTGNLDYNNSCDLMKVIQHYIHACNRSSIIVSHDINLSIEFADQIIVLTKNNGVGEILEENIYTSTIQKDKKIWFDSQGDQMEGFFGYLQRKLF
jgi:ABC-type lipoprotein export system ATPase subunit